MDRGYTIDGRLDELEQIVEDSAALIERQRVKHDALHAMWRELVRSANDDAVKLAEATRRSDAWRERAAQAVRQRDDAKAEASRLRADLAAITERSEAKPGRPTTNAAGDYLAMVVGIPLVAGGMFLAAKFLWNTVQIIGILSLGGWF